MTDYRCYFMDEEDHVRGVANHVAGGDDAEASRIAKALLAEKCRPPLPCRFNSVEVWDRTRKVSRFTKVCHWAQADLGKAETR